jgi:hypothetical protein
MKRIIGALMIAFAAGHARAAEPRTIDARNIPDHPITWACYFREEYVTNGAGSAWLEGITVSGTTEADCKAAEAEAGNTLARWHFTCAAFVSVVMDSGYGEHIRCRVPGGIADYYTNPDSPVYEVR